MQNTGHKLVHAWCTYDYDAYHRKSKLSYIIGNGWALALYVGIHDALDLQVPLDLLGHHQGNDDMHTKLCNHGQWLRS